MVNIDSDYEKSWFWCQRVLFDKTSFIVEFFGLHLAWDGRSRLEKFYQFKLIFSGHSRTEAYEDRDGVVGEGVGTADAAEGEVAGGCDEESIAERERRGSVLVY